MTAELGARHVPDSTRRGNWSWSHAAGRAVGPADVSSAARAGARRHLALAAPVRDPAAAATAARLDQRDRGPTESRQRAMVTQIYAHIEANLGDPGLTPATVAAAIPISVRYLHKLFETEQTTVADWIRRRRLEQARRDLLDPASRYVPVGAIGARWGLADPAHFTRLFRAAYGDPPARYRREVGPDVRACA